ncbi:hypothetical protein GCM10009087_52450 [Sphingomonas oligophenolica]|uniref:Uncharacterized protein n=1 Tax=Sphingomonas oligophenolica TaxID=301154 RepID=A0ABU9Y6Y7_9SPHN
MLTHRILHRRCTKNAYDPHVTEGRGPVGSLRVHSSVEQAMMTRESINGISGFAPILMSLAAFGLVLFSAGTGWERNLADEGAAAHLFQLLICLELPIAAVFLWTADWKRSRPVIGLLTAQAAALLLALGSVGFFGL